MERAPEKIRGELTRWMLEVKAGVFVGNISAAVRELLWEKINSEIETGAAMIIHSAKNEQGFVIKMCHSPKRSVVDMDGLFLIKTEDCNV